MKPKNKNLKTRRQDLNEKAEEIKELVDDIINERIDVPNNALIADFDATLNIFTKKRIELIDLINLHNPKSIKELSELSKRTKQAVDRDLSMLEEFDVIERKKIGKFTMPIVKRDIIILKLKRTAPEKKEILIAEVYCDNKNINEIIGVAHE